MHIVKSNRGDCVTLPGGAFSARISGCLRHVHLVVTRRFPAAVRLLLICFALATMGAQCNSPYPADEEGKNILYGFFTDQPKHLDPARSYASNETEVLCTVDEPLFQYNFLKRPYEMEPLTAAKMPVAEHRQIVFEGKSVDAIVYRVTLKKGIYFADHPCFVERNRRLTDADVRKVSTVWDIHPSGRRELVAADFILAIQRLADPRLACPIYPTLAENLLGMDEFQRSLQHELDAKRQVRRAAAGSLYSEEADEKFDPIHLDYAALGKEIPFVREVDRYTFEVALSQPYPQILYWMASPFFVPVPREALDFFDQSALLRKSIVFDFNPVGTGPFVMREYDPTNQIVFERNPSYRDERYPLLPPPAPGDELAAANYQRMKDADMLEDAGRKLPMVDGVVWRLEKETIPRWNKFVQGYLDYESTERRHQELVGDAIALSAGGDLRLSDEMTARGIRMEAAYPTSHIYYAFNMNDPVVGGNSPEKRKLRQAISIAFDTEEKITIFGNGQGIPAMGPLAPGIFGYEEGKAGMNPVVFRWDQGLQRPVRRPIDDAKKLLAEAGYPDGYGPDGQPLTIRYIAGGLRATNNPAWADFVRKQFARLNIRLVFEVSDFNRFQDKVKNGNFQILDWGWVADYPDPENFLYLLYGPNSKTLSGGENIANYHNPRYDELFVKMRAMENGPERLAIIRQMIDIARNDAPWIFGEHLAEFVIHHDYFHNTYPNAIAFNTVKYKRVDVARRTAYRAAHNQPRWQPLAVLAGILLAAALPALWAARRRGRLGGGAGL